MSIGAEQWALARSADSPSGLLWRVGEESVEAAIFRPASARRLRDPNVGDPVAGSPCEASRNVFPLEVGRRSANAGWVDVLQRVYVDDRIVMVLDPARGQRHHAALRAHMKFSGCRAKRV